MIISSPRTTVSVFDSVMFVSIEPFGYPDVLALILCGFASTFVPGLWVYSLILKVTLPLSSVFPVDTIFKSLSNTCTNALLTGK